MKIITLSFDDGEIFDIRLAHLLRKYDLKATFYLCSSHIGLIMDLPDGRHVEKVKREDIRKTYEGFEIGSHGDNHQGFIKLSQEELVETIEKDKQIFGEYSDFPIICAAYPGGGYSLGTVSNLEKTTPVLFARTTCREGYLFEIPKNPYVCIPSAHLFQENIYQLIEEFDAIETDVVKILHIYAHSYEMEWQRENGWEECEKIFQRLVKVKNANFMTNGEAYKMAFANYED